MNYSEEPNANSTMLEPGSCSQTDEPKLCSQSIEPGLCNRTTDPNLCSPTNESRLCSQTDPCIRATYSIINHSLRRNSTRTCIPKNVTAQSECSSGECSMHSHSVGHMSHIPRIPPSPTTYTLPSVLDKSTVTMCGQENNLFGMIKLRDNDVCYTSGTIEWVGRKRNYPINSGFKLINEQCYDTQVKKVKKINKTFTCDKSRHKDCDCADVLPTVNAIVDHLNALHEAVDIVDLRLNTLEDVISKID